MGMKKNLSNQKGYTIVELLIVITIIGLVITTVSQFFILQVKANNDGQNNLIIHEEANKASDELTQDIWVSDSVSSITMDEATHHVSEIQLHIPNLTNYPSGATIVLRLNSDGKLIKNPAAENLTVATNIDSIVAAPFQKGSATVVPVSYTSPTDNSFINSGSNVTTGLQITLNMKSGNKTDSFSQEVFFRNAP